MWRRLKNDRVYDLRFELLILKFLELWEGTCVKDSWSRALPKEIFPRFPNLTPAVCINACKAKKFRYAGVQDSVQCFCGNNAPVTRIAPMKECNKVCKGDKSLICGGIWRMNVYYTHI